MELVPLTPEMITLYKSGLSLQKVAYECRCSNYAVYRRLLAAGVQMRASRHRRFTEDDREAMAELYLQGYSLKEVAEVSNCCHSTVAYCLDRQGVKLRPPAYHPNNGD